jgi:hypothetical protein
VELQGRSQQSHDGPLRGCEKFPAPNISVIPANAGIQFARLTSLKVNQINNLDSGCRRNDGWGRAGKIHSR